MNRLKLTDTEKQGWLTMVNATTVDTVKTDPILAVWKLLLAKNGESWDDASSINPTEYALPEDQWKWLADKHVTRVAALRGDLAASNTAMDWVNVGPSSYREVSPDFRLIVSTNPDIPGLMLSDAIVGRRGRHG